jgi:precorrin-6B methylase 2
MSTLTITTDAQAADATPLDPAPLDETPSVDAVAERIMSAALGWIDLMSIHVGSQLGWYRALAASGAQGLTADELAGVTASSPRYAREWLEQQAASGLLGVASDGSDEGGAGESGAGESGAGKSSAGDSGAEDHADEIGSGRRFRLDRATAEVLADGASLSFLEPLARMLAASGERMPEIIDAYRTGGGVSWERLGVHAREAQAEMNRPWFERMPGVLADVPGVHDVLSRPGARIADVGAGAGWSSIALALAHPQLRVEGFDIDEPSVRLARENARAAGVADRVTFHLEDAARLADHGPFDAVFAFECLHDMPHPVTVLAAARAAVIPGGPVIVMDEATAEQFSPDADELERLLYGFSLFVCLPDGLSHPPSVGTGTVMRPSTLRSYAREAGWTDVEVVVPEFGLWRFYRLH